MEGVGMMTGKFDLDFYKNKKVLVTGHTGFKGTWLCKMLTNLGANVTGYALEAPTNPSLFELSRMVGDINSVRGDIRDYKSLKSVFDEIQPEIVFHLAAQPIVRRSYQNPMYTYETNVMGTVHVLECIRTTKSVKSFLNVTTDKVYLNREWPWPYRESDRMDGYDPYSNSKSCSELVTRCYQNSFFKGREISVSTARAGNVIGGGDFAEDRIIPDCIRAVEQKKEILVRNPFSVRPYQHVLEALYAYLMIAAVQYEEPTCAGNYNIGPNDADCLQTGELVELFVRQWGEGAKWSSCCKDGPHEANFLRLDCSRIKSVFGWSPCWNIETAVKMVVEWSKCWMIGYDVRVCMDRQIEKYFDEVH